MALLIEDISGNITGGIFHAVFLVTYQIFFGQRKQDKVNTPRKFNK